MPNIVYLQEPDELSLTGNQMIFRIAAKNAFVSRGKACQYELNLYKSYTSPGYITFSWNEGSVTFSCVTDPDESGTQYPPAATNPDICSYLNQNALLVKYFIVSKINGQNTQLLIEARNAGDQYQLSIHSNQYPILTNTIPSAADVLQDFYRVSVMLQQGKRILTTLDLPVEHVLQSDVLPADFSFDNTGVVTLDISDFFQKTMNGHFTFPPLTINSKVHAIIGQFQIFANEKYGNPITDKAGLISPIYNYMQGRLGNFTQGELNDLKKTFLTKLLESGMFLSTAPTVKITDIYAPERL